MASRSQEFVTSPFENVLNFLGSLPQGHEKAVKHALYNALALFLLLVCIAAGWALFIVLEPFIKPLIWALLCGSVLHPFKYSLATVLHSWLQTMESSSTMLFVGIPMLPINVIDDISEKIGGTFRTHLKKLLLLAGTGAVLHVLYTYTPTICTTLVWKLGILGNIALLWLIQHFTTTVAVTVLMAYVIILAIWWHPSRSRYFMYAAFVVWSLMGCYIANFVDAFQVSIFFFIVILLVAGFGIEVHQMHNNLKEGDKPVSYTAIVRWILMMRDDPQDSYKELENLSKESEKQPKEETEEKEEQQVKEADRPESPKSALEVQPGAVPQRVQRLDRPPSALARRGLRGSLYIRELSYIDLFDEDTNESGKYIYGVLWGCGIMLLYKNNWLLMLCPLPLFIYVVKHLGFYIGLWDFLLGRVQRIIDEIKNWCAVRKNALFPAPVLGLFKLGASVNKVIIGILMSSVDSAASVVVILGITLFSISMSIFVALQVYAEGIHLVHMGASIINNTVVAHSDLLGTIPEDWQEQMNSVLDNVYSYGREGISKMVRGWMKDVEDQKAAHLEKQILELWDRVYQSWMMSSSEASLVGPVVSPAAAFASWDGVTEALKKSPEIFNMNAVVNFAKENIEMLASLLDSLWAIFKGNVSVAFYSCTALINIVFGGGTAVLNFLLNLVVFLTALFYLLSSSGELYKPVDLITNFSPVMGNRFATAIERAVMGVFRASFKMAVFYGLWTWFVHNLFDVKIVYLPSVIAAILAVVPFLGTYWACIPAVAELWLLHDRGMLALLLLLFQFLPTSVVDTTFYKEIKGGGHPYLTGLSIAGGIFCMGAEGAIVGPLLLCGLFVAVNMSGSLMKESPSEPHFPSHLGHVNIPGSITQMSRLKRVTQLLGKAKEQ